MKFAIPDSDSDEDYVVVVEDDDSFLSDDSDNVGRVPDLTRCVHSSNSVLTLSLPRTKLGATIRDFLASSESEDEPDSEDEVGDLLDMRSVASKRSWREPK